MKKATEVHGQLVERFKALVPDGNFTLYVIMQPLCASFARHSAARGGNMMFGPDRDPGPGPDAGDDCVLMIAAVEVATPELRAAGFPVFRAGVGEIEAFAEARGK